MDEADVDFDRQLLDDSVALVDAAMMDESAETMDAGDPSPYWYTDWPSERTKTFEATLRQVLDETISPKAAAEAIVAVEAERTEWRSVLQHRTRSEVIAMLTNVMARHVDRPGRFWQMDMLMGARVEVLTHALYFALCDAALVDVPLRATWQAIFSSSEAAAWREHASSRQPYLGSVNVLSKRAASGAKDHALSWKPDSKLVTGIAAHVLGDFTPSRESRYTSTPEGMAAAQRIEDLLMYGRVFSFALSGTRHLEGSLGDSGNGQSFALRLLHDAYRSASSMLVCAIDKSGVPFPPREVEKALG